MDNRTVVHDDRLPPITLPRGTEFRWCLYCEAVFLATDADPFCGEECAEAEESEEAQ